MGQVEVQCGHLEFTVFISFPIRVPESHSTSIRKERESLLKLSSPIPHIGLVNLVESLHVVGRGAIDLLLLSGREREHVLVLVHRLGHKVSDELAEGPERETGNHYYRLIV